MMKEPAAKAWLFFVVSSKLLLGSLKDDLLPVQGPVLKTVAGPF
jgi:hypothetical protein